MSDQIPTFNYQKYSQGIEFQTQQMSQKTRGAVSEEPMSGKRVFFDQMGEVKAQPKTGRSVDITQVNTPMGRRSCTARDFEWCDFVDEFDKLKILNDPTNAMSQTFAFSNARGIDALTVEAALGTAWTGEEGTTPIVLPSSQKIAAASAGFTLAKLRRAIAVIKGANGLVPGDTVHVAYTARQEEEFIDSKEVKSSDFNNKKVMVDGELEYFYGAHFHRMEDSAVSGQILPKVSTTRTCLVWVKSGIKLGTWKAPFGRVEWNVSKGSWQVTAGMSVGATRMQETKVVAIDVVES